MNSSTNDRNDFYGNSESNRKTVNSRRPVNATGSAPKLFGYNNNSVNPSGVTNPYGTENGNSNTNTNLSMNNGAGLRSDQGKGTSDWFSSAPTPTHVANPYAVQNTNSSINISNGPTSMNPIDNSTMNQSTSKEMLNPAIPSSTLGTHTNDTFAGSTQMPGAFAGPMMQMPGAHSGANSNMGIHSHSMTPIPGLEDYDNEPPLLEELGINLDHIRTKSLAVLLPMKYAKNNIDSTIMEDDDMAGPLAFILLLGGELLLAAKMNFGYIYGLSLFGCFAMTLMLNLLSPTDSISMWTVLSVLGYSLLPVNTLAGVNVLYRIRHMGSVGVVLAVLTIAWCACSSTRLFERGCGLRDQRFLVAYPVALFYSAFVMLTIF